MPKMTDANYYALAISVITGKAPDKALADMGITVEERWYKPNRDIFGNRPGKTLQTAIYILHAICGVGTRQLVPMLGISHTTIHAAIRSLRRELGND